MLHASLYTTSNSAYGNFDPPAKSKYTTSGTFLNASLAPKRLPDFVGVFDNKGSVEDKPRLGVVFNGSVEYVTDGDASVLAAHDLESISLIDPAAALYVACTSLGKTHVFRLQQTATGYAAIQVATGQLPVPEGEATDIWSNPMRTNIEATRCLPSAPPALGGGKMPLMIWGSRGGNDYAGVEGSKKPEGIPAWLRMAPFDPTTGMVDETKMTQQPFTNLGDTPAWRALSSLDIVGDQMYFTCAYDGEEDGKVVSTEDVLRTGANKEAFRSLVGRLALPDGEPAIVGRYDGLKIEGVMSLGNNQLLLGSDDEALGCLVAAATLIDNGSAIEPNIKFINLGMRASAQNESVELKRWGLSGMAPFCF